MHHPDHQPQFHRPSAADRRPAVTLDPRRRILPEAPSFDPSHLSDPESKPTDALVGLAMMAVPLSIPLDIQHDMTSASHGVDASAFHAAGVSIGASINGLGESLAAVDLGAAVNRGVVYLHSVKDRVHSPVAHLGPPEDWADAIRATVRDHFQRQLVAIDQATRFSQAFLDQLGKLALERCTPEPTSSQATPTIRANPLSSPDTAPLTTTFRSEQSLAAQKMQLLVDEAAAKWTAQIGEPAKGATMDIVTPTRERLEQGIVPRYWMQKDNTGDTYVPFYRDGKLVRFIPVPTAGGGPKGVEWQKGPDPVLKIHFSDSRVAVYDQSVGAFIVLPSDANGDIGFSLSGETKDALSRFVMDRYEELDRRGAGNNSIVKIEPLAEGGKIQLVASVISEASANNSDWVMRKDNKVVPLPQPPAGQEWIVTPDGTIFSRKKGATNRTSDASALLFDPNKGDKGEVAAAVTPTPTILPPTPTTEPTVRPTEIPRPAPVVIARYGDEKDLINFNYPDKGGIPYTIHVFNDERTWAPTKNATLGVRTLSYLTLPLGKPSYDLFRAGESSGGQIYNTSGYFFPVTEARWADQGRGTFVIKSQVVNSSGVTVYLEITMIKDNPVYSHIPPSDKRTGAKFYRLIGSEGKPIQASPSLIRDKKNSTEEAEFDVIGIGGKDPVFGDFLRDKINAATGSKPLVKLTGVGNPDVWLILLAH